MLGPSPSKCVCQGIGSALFDRHLKRWQQNPPEMCIALADTPETSCWSGMNIGQMSSCQHTSILAECKGRSRRPIAKFVDANAEGCEHFLVDTLPSESNTDLRVPGKHSSCRVFQHTKNSGGFPREATRAAGGTAVQMQKAVHTDN
eukprot:363984-Chlamydomonas_euryale.AAC.9